MELEQEQQEGGAGAHRVSPLSRGPRLCPNAKAVRARSGRRSDGSLAGAAPRTQHGMIFRERWALPHPPVSTCATPPTGRRDLTRVLCRRADTDRGPCLHDLDFELHQGRLCAIVGKGPPPVAVQKPR